MRLPINAWTSPVGDYLKGLGLLQILNEQLPSEVKGHWKKGQFVLDTDCSRDRLVEFFLHKYRPSPICSPWNGSSGFYKPNDAAAFIEASKCDRWAALQEAYALGRQVINELDLKKQPDQNTKAKMIRRLRQLDSEEYRRWLDCVAIVVEGKKKTEIRFSYFLGTIGNIGAKDIGAVLAECLDLLWDLETGNPKPETERRIRASLFGAESDGLEPMAGMMQYAPVTDFLNDGDAFRSKPYPESGGSSNAGCNPFDVLLMIHGLLTFSGMTARDNQSEKDPIAKFSLAVDLASGTADTACKSESRIQIEEIWLPLWDQPLTHKQVRDFIYKMLRQPVSNQPIADSIDFAYEVAHFGKNHKIPLFLRCGILPRKGQSNFVIPIEVFPSQEIDPDVAAELRPFRLSMRRLVRKLGDRITSLQQQVNQLEGCLMALARKDGSYIETLTVLGELEATLTYNSILGNEYIAVLPPLKDAWLDRVLEEEDSCEVRLALSLASLWLRTRLSRARLKEGKWYWQTNAKLHWHPGKLVDSLITLLKRWDVEQADSGQPSYPKLQISPKLLDIRQFIAGQVDDQRIECLARGLALIRMKPPEKVEGMSRGAELLPPIYSMSALAYWQLKRSIPDVRASLSLNQPERAFRAVHSILATEQLTPVFQQEPTIHARRIAAALAFPLCGFQLDAIRKHIAD